MALITISQSTGSGDAGIARQVAKSLDVELYDDLKLKEKALQMGIRQEDLKGLDEKAPGFLDHFLSYKPESYRELMEAVVYEISGSGNGVVMGHGSQILLRDFGCALHVRIHSTEENRIENLVRQQGLSRETAAKLIHKKDHEQKGFFRFAFNMAWDDPALYDLIINPAKISTDMAVKLILETARSDEINSCSLTALDTMERRSLESRVRSELLVNNLSLSTLVLDVPSQGVVSLRGYAYSNEDMNRILAITKKVPGVKDVQPEIAVMEGFYE